MPLFFDCCLDCARLRVSDALGLTIAAGLLVIVWREAFDQDMLRVIGVWVLLYVFSQSASGSCISQPLGYPLRSSR